MEQEITLVLNYLDKIGEKLGIGAEKLWPYLMRQMYMEGMVSIVAFFFFLSLAAIGWRIYSKNPERHEDKWHDATYFNMWFVIVSGVCSGVAFIRFLFFGFYQIVNTEFKAFEALVDMLKNVK